MTTLLLYGLATDPFPLRASPDSGLPDIATLTIVAANPNADPDTPFSLIRPIVLLL